MKTKIIIISILLFGIKSFAQTETNNEILTSQNSDVAAVFNNKPGGVNKFREEVAKRIDLSGYNWKSSFTVEFSFVVDTNGKIIDVKAEKSSGVQEFDDRFIYAIKSFSKKWAPAKVNGVPVRSRFKIPFNISAMN